MTSRWAHLLCALQVFGCGKHKKQTKRRACRVKSLSGWRNAYCAPGALQLCRNTRLQLKLKLSPSCLRFGSEQLANWGWLEPFAKKKKKEKKRTVVALFQTWFMLYVIHCWGLSSWNILFLPLGFCVLLCWSVHPYLGYPRPAKLDALSQRGSFVGHQRNQLEQERAVPAVRRGRRAPEGLGPATV